MKYLLLMLQFFTRIPLPHAPPADPADFPHGVKYFPVVGLVVGVFNFLCYLLFSLGGSKILAALGVVLANLLITGALHLDGLADTCDGLFSARAREKMLEIMRDSRIGTNGAIAVFFDLGLKLALLWQIDGPDLMRGILIAPVVSRTMLVILLLTCPPARAGSGLGNLFIGKTDWPSNLGAFAFCLAITAAVCGCRGMIMIGFNLGAVALYRRLVLRKIGGMTGDTLGAMNEVGEVAALMAFLIT
ncbi:MAG: adenosylcobinamide-GDP ribazoletransferase [Bacillota bacterium]|jgi:adenosylcobinamide-GDP ribazoletransferase